MEAKLSQPGRNLAGLLVGELNPNPRADNLGPVEKVGGGVFKSVEQLLGGQLPVYLTGSVINNRPGRVSVRR